MLLKTVKNTVLPLSLVGLMCGAQSALAYEAGDVIVRGGVAVVDPNESSSPVVIDTLGLGATTTTVGVGSDTQLGLTLSYMLSDHVSVELLASTPFTHDIYANGGATLAEATHLPPTLSWNYYFNDSQASFQPYIGAGINYTIFFDESVNSNLDDATLSALVEQATGGALAGAITNSSGTSIDLENSLGLAIQFGFDYALTENIALNLAYWRINLDTEAEITTTADVATVGTAVPIKTHVNVDIDPSVYMLGIAYKF